MGNLDIFENLAKCAFDDDAKDKLSAQMPNEIREFYEKNNHGGIRALLQTDGKKPFPDTVKIIEFK